MDKLKYTCKDCDNVWLYPIQTTVNELLKSFRCPECHSGRITVERVYKEDKE